jgi:hypothetical protein
MSTGTTRRRLSLLTKHCTAASADAEDDIKTMKLYTSLDRVENELRNAGIGETESLTPAQLYPYDSMHYEGYDAIEEAVQTLKVQLFAGFSSFANIVCVWYPAPIGIVCARRRLRVRGTSSLPR